MSSSGPYGSQNPYQSPQLLPPGTPLPAAASGGHVYRPADQLVLALTLLLAVNLLMSVVGACSSWMEQGLLQAVAGGQPLGDAEADANDARQRLIAAAQVLLHLVTAVVFAVWIHRANRNARALGAEGMQFTPGWSVGWYFVPIANLFKPFQAMREIWLASSPTVASPPDGWRYGPSTPLLGIWWTLWLAAAFVGQAALRLSMRAQSLEALINSSLLQILANVLDVPLVVAAILLVRGIHARQVAKSRTLGLDPTAMPFGVAMPFGAATPPSQR